MFGAIDTSWQDSVPLLSLSCCIHLLLLMLFSSAPRDRHEVLPREHDRRTIAIDASSANGVASVILKVIIVNTTERGYRVVLTPMMVLLHLSLLILLPSTSTVNHHTTVLKDCGIRCITLDIFVDELFFCSLD